MADRPGLLRAGSPAAARASPMPVQPHGQRQSSAKHHLRQKERDVLVEMINAAVPLDGSGRPLFADAAQQPGSPSSVWRLLIFDDVGRDIMAPLLKVGSLRELGVTLYMHINTERDPVPGAPALYLCAPTEENIARIARDCGERLYEWVYVNFTAQVPRQQLESLAQQLVATQLPSIHHVRVFDRTLSYVALDNDLFSLMLPHSFLTLNRRGASDADIDAHLNAVVLGISHVLLSLQALPVIAHSKTGPAEEVARRLSVRLTDAQKERQLVPAPSTYLGRPLLLLVDRASDLATALHHPFTYRGLLVDEADMRLNKCMIHGSDGHDEVFEVDPDRDTFYTENASYDFGVFGGKFDAALKQYKEEYAALASESSDGVGDDGGGGGDGGASAVSKLLASAPLLAERKRYLDAHAKLANSFLQVIRAKHLDSFHGVELGVLHRSGLDKEEFTKLLRTRAGTLADRQRLYLIAYLMCTDQGDEEAFVQRMLSHVEQDPEAAGGAPVAPVAAAGAAATAKPAANPFPALQYLRHLRNWSLGAHSPSAKAPCGASGDSGLGWGGFAQQIARNLASTLGANVDTALPLTKLVTTLLQDPQPYAGGSPGVGGPSSSPTSGGGGHTVRAKMLESLAGYDPHTRKPVNLADVFFSQVIVFTIGGGSIAEYDDLKKWEATRPHKAIAYGCTAITSGEEMLRELSALGSEV